jgi:hypothetical protein
VKRREEEVLDGRGAQESSNPPSATPDSRSHGGVEEDVSAGRDAVLEERADARSGANECDRESVTAESGEPSVIGAERPMHSPGHSVID